MMKRSLLGIALILGLSGCGAWPLVKFALTGEVDMPEVPPVHCIVSYAPSVNPEWILGSDGCGNSWGKRVDDGTCWYEPSPGLVLQLDCPAEGDTLVTIQ